MDLEEVGGEGLDVVKISTCARTRESAVLCPYKGISRRLTRVMARRLDSVSTVA